MQAFKTCLTKSIKPTASTIIPRRFRYYWEARPENRTRKLIMQVTLPRVKGQKQFDNFFQNNVIEDKLYGLDVVLHREAVELFQKSRFIAVLLKAEMDEEEFYITRHKFKKDNIVMEDFPIHVIEHAISNTNLKNLLRLYTNEAYTIFSDELNLQNFQKIIKSNPQLLLLGGMIDNEFLSAEKIIECTKLPSLDVLRGELSGTLSAITASTYNILQKHQSSTSILLTQYIKEKSPS